MTWMYRSFFVVGLLAAPVAGCKMVNPAFVDSGTAGSSGGTGDSASSSASAGQTSGATSVGTASGTGTTAGAMCGNGIKEAGEECDGADLGGITCEGQGFDGGTVACREDCTLDFGGCIGSGCGNDVAEGSEQCDGMDLAGASCGDVGHSHGTPACNMDCTLNYDGCYTCGDGKVDGPEVCDGEAGVGTCEDLGNGYHSPGSPSCADDCLAILPGDCPQCGNDILEDGEACDKTKVDAVCSELGNYDAGTVTCTATCEYDTSNCSLCGNGVIEGNEACEDGVPFTEDCKDLGFDQAKPNGGLSCSAECVFDTSGCCNLDNKPCESTDECCPGLTCVPVGMNNKLCLGMPCGGMGTTCANDDECCSQQCGVNNKCL